MSDTTKITDDDVACRMAAYRYEAIRARRMSERVALNPSEAYHHELARQQQVIASAGRELSETTVPLTMAGLLSDDENDRTVQCLETGYVELTRARRRIQAA